MDKELHFEINDRGNFLLVKLITIYPREGSTPLLIDAIVHAKEGAVTKEVAIDMEGYDFEMLEQQLQFMYDGRINEAFFNSIGSLRIQFKMNAPNECQASYSATAYESECGGELLLDRSKMAGLIKQVQAIRQSIE